MCKKRTYTSAKVAKRGHARLKARIRAYYCRECAGWHVTNQEKR